jgi:hypothetical protein
MGITVEAPLANPVLLEGPEAVNIKETIDVSTPKRILFLPEVEEKTDNKS